MIYSLGFIAFVFGGIIWLLISGYDAGRDREKVGSLGDALDQVDRANKANDRFDSDDDYAARLLDKYRRK